MDGRPEEVRTRQHRSLQIGAVIRAQPPGLRRHGVYPGVPPSFGMPTQTPLDQAPVATLPWYSKKRFGIKNFIWAALLLIVVVSSASFVVANLMRPSANSRYVAALRQRGLLNQFAGTNVAINVGHKVCTDIDNGAKDQGNETSRVAVQFLCPSYLSHYQVLRVAHVTGTFTISNASYDPTNEYENPNFQTVGNYCYGNGGYSDLGDATEVTVSGDDGKQLAITTLGSGSASGDGSNVTDTCDFTFQFSVTEGQSAYVVTVGKRGTETYTFDQLLQPGAIALSIGTS